MVTLRVQKMKFDLARYAAFQKAYEKESDRSVAILASSYLEKYLEEYIAKKLVDDKAVAKLFEGFGPLSTFSAKIEFAFGWDFCPSMSIPISERLRKFAICSRMNQTVQTFWQIRSKISAPPSGAFLDLMAPGATRRNQGTNSCLRSSGHFSTWTQRRDASRG